MSAFSAERFIRERNEALLSLDKERIQAFMKKYDMQYPSDNDLVFWAGVHKAILAINAASPEQKEQSADWLLDHGFGL